ncbi:3'(2'),5'-bisphosphate nucleotidase CysQ [Sphingomicrobium lutaoense]|uniref:3'(2'),5'-bisphosphate nucleotidase CysQ n=1 Tax=Sphingomicrobium lutaoense TaxID=515949 RepID=A0A839Z2W9_9SPHN|nr:3'(2'),5'-bisphosphate nucleotidase CysQ [Sphingomicrobium lutaoense]MBB3764103.1 3'(2'), 5'-bisphosphate nucleotidase [Sphingomicrobium lutaoense]
MAEPRIHIASAVLAEQLGEAAREAGAAILEVVRKGFTAQKKIDASPVTDADHAAEAVVLAALARHAPGVPVVAEEQFAKGIVPDHGSSFFLVDPLDGTKSFIKGGDDYTVNIGLIEDGIPSLGAIYAPATDRLWIAHHGGKAICEDEAGRRTVHVRERASPMVALASKNHFTQGAADYLERAFPGEAIEQRAVGSSLKFGILASGDADIYPRLGPTSEWDTAAGHAILIAAGGRCDGPDGQPLRYGKKSYFNPGFCATSGWEAPPIASYMEPFGGGGDLPQGV